MGPTRTSSLGGKKYILVIVDDYSHYTWALLLREKSDAVVQENSDRAKLSEEECGKLLKKYRHWKARALKYLKELSLMPWL
jgi:hypothetical protein